MVDATDSKSVFCEGVRVRVPSPAVWESPGEISGVLPVKWTMNNNKF